MRGKKSGLGVKAGGGGGHWGSETEVAATTFRGSHTIRLSHTLWASCVSLPPLSHAHAHH